MSDDTVAWLREVVEAVYGSFEPTATPVRVRNGKISVTNGPFTETKEQGGGFFTINARDLNEAM